MSDFTDLLQEHRPIREQPDTRYSRCHRCAEIWPCDTSVILAELAEIKDTLASLHCKAYDL